ncbi:MAG: hypothetical protein V2A77_10665, partial [Pseudomonadota bacterium]
MKNPSLKRTVVMQRLSRLLATKKVLVDPAALLAEPFRPAPGGRVLAGGGPARLYLLDQDCFARLRDLPEEVTAGDITECLEKTTLETLDPRFLPLDHPEGIISRFNSWFYLGKGEMAFAEGQVPTGLARDRHLIRAEATLVARLAALTGTPRPTMLKVGVGCDVEPVRVLLEELARLGGGLAERCSVVVSDLSPPLIAEARRRAGLDPLLAEVLRQGRLRFEVLDARRLDGLGDDRFLIIQSSYLYDSLPQRELARVGGRWYEFKARPMLKNCSQRAEFARVLMNDDLAGLQMVPTHRFGYLDWDTVLDPLAPEDVPHLSRLESVVPPELGDVAVPLGDALIAGFEAQLAHVVPGGVVQTFDLGIAGLGPLDPHLKPVFKGPHRICAALFLGQNFALARSVFLERGCGVELTAPDRYLEEVWSGEEVICLDRLWEAQHKGDDALKGLFDGDFVSRYRGCLEGKGGSIFRRLAQGHFLTRPEGAALAAE